MTRIVVGAAVIQSGRLLAAQRAEPPELAGGWEFPGGKVEPGESEHEALIRECQEELGVRVHVGARIGGDWILAADLILRVWQVRIIEGTPEPREHLELRWLRHSELFDIPWLPADLPIVHAVAPLLL